MPRLAAEQWAEIRVRREAGESFGSLGKAFGVNEAAIFRRSKKEGWGDGVDVGAAVRRRVNERVNGVVNGISSAEKVAAIDRAAEIGAEIIAKHQRDWELHREFFGSVSADFDAGRHAKINAEALKILQEGERKAYNLEPVLGDITKLSDAQIDALASGKMPK